MTSNVSSPPEEINLAPKMTSLKGLALNDLNQLNGSGHNNNNGNRSRMNSEGSFGNNNNGTPAGSADTRRRITKLSKAREREKVPRLVEYFCVVSTSHGSGGGANNNNGWTGAKASGSVIRVLHAEPCNSSVGSKNKNDTQQETTEKTTPPAKLDGSEFQPQITARYPTQDHEENPLLPDSIIAFCVPSGKIPIISSNENTTADTTNVDCDEINNGMPKVHYFVTTGESGQKMYGTCLTVWEPHLVTTTTMVQKQAGGVGKKKDAPAYNKRDFVEDKNGSHNADTTKQVVHLPKCLVILSVHPYLVAFREYLTQLHRLSKMVSPMITNGGDGGDKSASSSSATAAGTTATDNNGIIQLTTTTSSNNNILKTAMSLPIERYITNFCSELPAPPPGSFEVQTTILDSVISIWSPPNNMPIAWVSLPFSHLFQCLDVDNVLKVWTALALERQVLITSTQLSLLTTCCEILLSLLFPMKWAHTYIPVLPHFLVPILSAPMPFLCGIDKRHLSDTMADLADECIVVDLDKNQVSLGVKTPPLPTLPRYVYNRLRNNVETNAGHVFREVRSLRKDDDTSEMGVHLPPEVKFIADSMWESRLSLFDEAFMLTFTPEERRKNLLNGDDGSGVNTNGNDPNEVMRIMTLSEKQNLRSQSTWDAVQEAFLETYCFLLQKYRKFLVFPSKANEGSYGGAGFRSQEFLASQRADVRAFLEEMVGSQMFDDFVTKRLYGSGEADISFFDTAVDRFVKNQSLLGRVAASSRNASNGTGGENQASGPGKRIRNLFANRGGGGGNNAGGTSLSEDGENGAPLLQSARVKRKLKTIVPPEPCGMDLPEGTTPENALMVQVSSERVVKEDIDDDGSGSVISAGTASSRPVSAGPIYYHYPIFPDRFEPELFGEPRPMSSAVIAEYDRQRENAGKFRQTANSAENVPAQNTRRAAGQLGGPVEKPATSEVTTFTVFFMAFTSVIGKDLMAVDNEALDQMDSKDIVSDYKREKSESENIADMVNDIVMDADLPPTPTRREKTDRKPPTPQRSPVRHRFNDKLSTLKIMEARETARAELGIAFEMLKMMKERGLRADPEAYQCLIDACGRCGDTNLATQLLSRMHEDGIVADGVVYSSLVSAFSAESAWKQVSGEAQEELPGESASIILVYTIKLFCCINCSC
jgi:pentatricopeptide repeat protein